MQWKLTSFQKDV